jgi:hypothetical protein
MSAASIRLLTGDGEDPGVVVCPECGRDFDTFERPGEPGYFAAVHNGLHHGGNPVAFVTTVDDPAEPTDPASETHRPGTGSIRGRIVGGMPENGKTAPTLRLTLTGLVAELHAAGGERA